MRFGDARAILTEDDPRLRTPATAYGTAAAVDAGELGALAATLAAFRAAHGFGRAIAAPQIGVARRAIAVDLGAGPFLLLDPEITWRSDEHFELWDDCFSVPGRLVRVRRACSISLSFRDARFRPRRWSRLPPDLAELLQHEIDHLDGVLMTARAVAADAIRPATERADLVDRARPTHRLALADIARAAATIDPLFSGSPTYECEPLSAELGCVLTLKVETTNPIRSFKGRGADFFLAEEAAAGRGGALVCASAGNFGQALAYGCRARGRALTVFAARSANPLKLERMRALEARVVLAGDDFDAAKAAARQHAATHGATFVEDGREAAISVGAGSIAVELVAARRDLDAIVVPLGNGALLAGMARWIKATAPWIEVIGAVAAGAPAMARSWRARRVVETERAATIADGIGVRVPVPEALDDLAGLLDDIVEVDEAHLVAAMRHVHRHAGLVVEPAGVAGVAAVLADRSRYAGRRIATVLAGSNLSDSQIATWLVPGIASSPTEKSHD